MDAKRSLEFAADMAGMEPEFIQEYVDDDGDDCIRYRVSIPGGLMPVGSCRREDLVKAIASKVKP